ncbi:T9SS type A sorting domain-containing protein [Cryomorpha ignava]|uniref:T9SS type A sorting domain-containing protein n=1 Tax=Cryomorpha ignava TaxID=101383 RepID=A0A7K3WTQ3_9FLAO|nr:T9SS type A sorting domain-containing protein [Cryomorpha ignava]NEN25069.1 T9SS type A sorting domain-containing protein [Cryomorpha ignava]
MLLHSAFCEEETLSIEDIDSSGESNLFDGYPNPFNSTVTIRGTFEGILTYYIYDISGRLILTKNFNSDKSFDIDLKSIESGTYILLIETDFEISSSKIIKL